MPINQLRMMKLLVNQSLYTEGRHATQVIGTVFDGIARHTLEDYAFQQQAAREGFLEAVRAYDGPFRELRRDRPTVDLGSPDRGAGVVLEAERL